MEKKDFALESFKNIQELIRFIDQKAGAVLVIAGLIFSAFIEFAKNLEFISFNDANFLGIISFLFGLLSIINLIIVIWISIFKILKPRLAKNYSANEHSLYYFEHLSKLGKENTLKEFENLNDESMLKHIIEQQFEVSQIMKKKTKYLGKSFNYLFASIISVIIFIISSTSI